MVTDQPPRFQALSHGQLERGRRPDMSSFAEPLPPELVALLDAKKVKAHRALVGRTAKQIQAAAAAAAKVEDAREHDRGALVDAAAAGRQPPEPTVPAAEAEAARADEIANAHVEAVVRSANELLAEALPKAADAIERVGDAIAAERSAQHELLVEAMARGRRAGELQLELDWLRRHAGAARVALYRGGAAQASALDRGIVEAIDAGERERRKNEEWRERAERERQALAAEAERRARQPDRTPARVRVTPGAPIERLPPAE